METKERKLSKKEWYLKNIKKITIQRKERYIRNKLENPALNKDYYKLHKESIKEYKRNHKVKIQEYKRLHKQERNENHRKRVKIDINYKLLHNLRGRLYKALKRNSKSIITIKLIGCSLNFLKHYLQSKFTKGMTWHNYGKWHIDHIKPCASFDLSKVSEQKKCFHYTNLQPLWAEDNLRKYKKIIYRSVR